MQLLTLGINHHTAPLSLREKVAFPLEQLKPALGTLRQHLPHRKSTAEAAILSTCNRTELYCATDGNLPEDTAHEHAIRWLAHHHNIDAGELAPHVYALGSRRPCATPSAWPAGSIPWCWARRRSSAR